MLEMFLATLNPMLMLFLIIAIGFLLRKFNILPESSGKTMAKLETWVLCPALSFSTMAKYCTVDSLSTHATNMVISLIGVGIAIAIAIPLSSLFVRKKCAERGIYCYAFAFANSGYMGDPIVQALFGDEILSYYKLFCLPIILLIMTWGLSILIPRSEKPGDALKAVFNPSVIAILLGVVAGLSGIGEIMPMFLTLSLDALKGCMGPVAMLLAGFTIAGYNTKAMLANKKVYIASILRLTVLPAVIIAAIFGIKELSNILFDLSIDNVVLFLALFAVGTPLGLNTIIFPEAYDGNPETGASMALISNIMSVITIPLMYVLMVLIFGAI